jgi:hypothetical protein
VLEIEKRHCKKRFSKMLYKFLWLYRILKNQHIKRYGSEKSKANHFRRNQSDGFS